MLSKLNINPIEIGLILTGVIENGFMFHASDLNLDTDGFRNDVINATSGAFNLACNMRWFSSTTTPTLISRASSEAMAVAIEASIVNDATTSFLLSQARSRALSLAGQLDSSALDDELAAALGAVAQSADVAPSEATKSEATSQKGVSTEQEEEEEGGAGFEGLGDLFG
jgi:large subunit ribosomal protein L10